jgi:hypothetical protein
VKFQSQLDVSLCKTIQSARTRKWVSQVLASCPPTGGPNGGIHRWLFVTALKLHPLIEDKSQLEQLLTEASANHGRAVSEREINNAIVNSQGSIGQVRIAPRWPQRNEEQITAIVRDGPDLAGLSAISPVRWRDDQPHTEEIIDILFPGNPLLCAGVKKEIAITRTRQEWRGFTSNQQFIVPSPMTSVFGLNKAGVNSMRCLANTGPRRFLIVEFDQGDFDQHAAVLIHLSKFAPLAVAVHSGNKSLHGWFHCAGQPEERLLRFFRYAVSLGADPATWTRCQFVRMPDGQRDNGKRQRVVYFDPRRLEVQ